jgi:hypothetical protein
MICELASLAESLPVIEQLHNVPTLIYAVFFFCLATAYLSLWWAAPDFRVFRNMGVFLFLATLQSTITYFGGERFQWALIAWTSALLVIIAGEAMRVRRRHWTLLIWPLCILVYFFAWLPALRFLQPLPVDISQVFLTILTVQGFLYGQRRERQIAAAFAFLVCVRWTLSPTFEALTHVPRVIEIGGWRWSINPASMILLATATLVIYVRDLTEDRREKQRLSAELAAGRAIQHVLIPDQSLSIPGFQIESVYRPAGEVGGDFFQIIPLKSGGVLVAIGDVSGKGMPAALLVSLLVGVLQTLADITTSPSKILSELNCRLLSRSAGGFTTCLILRADPDGTLVIANAGHLAPYVDGKELSLENSLPLGVFADTEYFESTFQFDPGWHITLVTDGVIEARDKHGTLFGFERTADLSTRSAEAIAETAQAFGQEDDITVLSMVRAQVSAII